MGTGLFQIIDARVDHVKGKMTTVTASTRQEWEDMKERVSKLRCDRLRPSQVLELEHVPELKPEATKPQHE